MNLVSLDQWPESKEHGKAVKRILHGSIEFEDGHITMGSSVEKLGEGQQECCDPPCNPIIDPFCP